MVDVQAERCASLLRIEAFFCLHDYFTCVRFAYRIRSITSNMYVLDVLVVQLVLFDNYYYYYYSIISPRQQTTILRLISDEDAGFWPLAEPGRVAFPLRQLQTQWDNLPCSQGIVSEWVF
jgi:hypothetical protein